MAVAMPWAIERSVASPTMRARLPARNPTLSASAQLGRVDVEYQSLASAQRAGGAHLVPAHQFAHGDVELVGDLGERIAAAHFVRHAARITRTGAARTIAGNVEARTDLQRGLARQVVRRGECGHRDTVTLGHRP